MRGFLPDEVPEPLMRDLFTLAQCAPSNCNVQPWSPHVVSGPSLAALRERLVAAARDPAAQNPDWPLEPKYEGVYRDRQWDAALQLYGAMGIERRDLPGREAAYLRNFACFDAPHAVFVFMPRPFDLRQALDCGIWLQTLMLVMASRGIASCAQGALGLYPDVVRTHLGLPATHRLLLGVSFGYEDPDVPANAARVGRATVEDAVTFHRQRNAPRMSDSESCDRGRPPEGTSG